MPTFRRGFFGIVAGPQTHGCDMVVLGCPELPLLALDSTRLLASAELDHPL